MTDRAELIDMRTHLTVAMLAAAQLHRKTKHVPEAGHLQNYLDQSLKSLVEDVGKVDKLMTHAVEPLPTASQPVRRWPWPVSWVTTVAKWVLSTVCTRVHRKGYTRMTTLYVPR